MFRVLMFLSLLFFSLLLFFVFSDFLCSLSLLRDLFLRLNEDAVAFCASRDTLGFALVILHWAAVMKGMHPWIPFSFFCLLLTCVHGLHIRAQSAIIIGK